MISLETSLQHLAWSNQKFFGYFTQLPDEVFGLTAAEGEWPVGRILTHLAGSGQWYRYCLTGIDWTDLKPITDAQVAAEYLKIIADLDAVLLANLALADELVTFEDETGPMSAPRSLILAQAVMHAAEHKGQIATILKQHGHHIDLDALDVWSLIAQTKDAN
jgi:uncharacterized damage-inducible protein DinB